MGQRMKIWATMTSIILLSGILGFGFSPVAFAGHDGQGQRQARAEGCTESDPRSSAAARNPHCIDPLPPSVCDSNNDGKITAAELAAHTGDSEPVALAKIRSAEGEGGSNQNDVIDTQKELDDLNRLFTSGC